VAPQLIFNQRLDGWLTVLFTVILWFVILDMSRICLRRLRGAQVLKVFRAAYQADEARADSSGGRTPRCRPGGALMSAVLRWFAAGVELSADRVGR